MDKSPRVKALKPVKTIPNGSPGNSKWEWIFAEAVRVFPLWLPLSIAPPYDPASFAGQLRTLANSRLRRHNLEVVCTGGLVYVRVNPEPRDHTLVPNRAPEQ